MNNKGTDFPQYRKLFNGKAFYKITSDRTFDEVQIIGTKALLYRFRAEKYPEILKIQELLACSTGYVASDVLEYETNKALTEE